MKEKFIIIESKNDKKIPCIEFNFQTFNNFILDTIIYDKKDYLSDFIFKNYDAISKIRVKFDAHSPVYLEKHFSHSLNNSAEIGRYSETNNNIYFFKMNGSVYIEYEIESFWQSELNTLYQSGIHIKWLNRYHILLEKKFINGYNIYATIRVKIPIVKKVSISPNFLNLFIYIYEHKRASITLKNIFRMEQYLSSKQIYYNLERIMEDRTKKIYETWKKKLKKLSPKFLEQFEKDYEFFVESVINLKYKDPKILKED